MPVYAYGKHTPRIDPSAYIFPSADVIGNVRIGAKVFVGAGAIIRGDYGVIDIDDGSAIEENATIHARMSQKTTICKNVTISHAAMIHTSTIRDGAVIGMKAVVSDFAEVGENAIVAEGAVVPSKARISPGSIAAGVPAVEIGKLKPEQIDFWQAVKQIYQDLCRQYPKKLRLLDPSEYIVKI
ncbi:MAG: gamma carbonic anhydrase family protein [Candidatus Lokiarchaeota archaeon]|nr:gamma carbonic anhydrase family protein [Candidatus Lokiarchaeota archaeon]